MRGVVILSLLAVAAMLTGCATIPSGPSVMSLPGAGKSFDQFRMDDALCRQFAYEQVGGTSKQQAAQNAAVGTGYASTSYYEAQRRYNHVYLQCMYAKGKQIPVYGGFSSQSRSAPSRWAPPPPSDYPPPPPPRE
jgi:hypothetical protein